MSRGNAVIGQSGGPTAVINQSLVGCLATLAESDAVGEILGARHAVSGIVKDNYVSLRGVAPEKLERIAVTPSSALGSSRDKPDREYCQRIFENFAKRDVRYFFYIGGNDSSDTCRIVNEVAAEKNHELHAFHIPKTIDNDLVHNDHTPGFASAAKFVAQAVAGDNLDNAALPGIKIDVIMGRHAGFLAAASLLARRHEGDGPHLIYVPERAFDLDAFTQRVAEIYEREGRCLVAVSEGIHDAEGTPIATKLAESVERDAHGNVQLSGSGALGDYLSQHLKSKLGGGLRVRADTFGYLQRSFVGVVSEIDQFEAREAGRVAARRALEGERQGSIAIERVSNEPYQVNFKQIELEAVAAKTRTLPEEYQLDGDIHSSYRDYLLPLTGPLPEVASFD